MNQALRQRLVGAVVLVALAVIFLPALFNGGRPHQFDSLKDIPASPQVSPLVLQEPQRPVADAEDKRAAANSMYALEAKPGASDNSQDPTKNIIPAAPTLGSKGVPQAWALQVGGFAETSKANALKKALQAKGYKAFTRSITTGTGADKKTIVRVMVGPEFEQSAISKKKTAIDRDFKVKSIVVKFEP